MGTQQNLDFNDSECDNIEVSAEYTEPLMYIFEPGSVLNDCGNDNVLDADSPPADDSASVDFSTDNDIVESLYDEETEAPVDSRYQTPGNEEAFDNSDENVVLDLTMSQNTSSCVPPSVVYEGAGSYDHQRLIPNSNVRNIQSAIGNVVGNVGLDRRSSRLDYSDVPASVVYGRAGSYDPQRVYPNSNFRNNQSPIGNLVGNIALDRTIYRNNYSDVPASVVYERAGPYPRRVYPNSNVRNNLSAIGNLVGNAALDHRISRYNYSDVPASSAYERAGSYDPQSVYPNSNNHSEIGNLVGNFALDRTISQNNYSDVPASVVYERAGSYDPQRVYPNSNNQSAIGNLVGNFALDRTISQNNYSNVPASVVYERAGPYPRRVYPNYNVRNNLSAICNLVGNAALDRRISRYNYSDVPASSAYERSGSYDPQRVYSNSNVRNNQSAVGNFVGNVAPDLTRSRNNYSDVPASIVSERAGSYINMIENQYVYARNIDVQHNRTALGNSVENASQHLAESYTPIANVHSSFVNEEVGPNNTINNQHVCPRNFHRNQAAFGNTIEEIPQHLSRVFSDNTLGGQMECDSSMQSNYNVSCNRGELENQDSNSDDSQSFGSRSSESHHSPDPTIHYGGNGIAAGNSEEYVPRLAGHSITGSTTYHSHGPDGFSQYHTLPPNANQSLMFIPPTSTAPFGGFRPPFRLVDRNPSSSHVSVMDPQLLLNQSLFCPYSYTQPNPSYVQSMPQGHSPSSGFEAMDCDQQVDIENSSPNIITISDDSESSLPNDIMSAEQLVRSGEIGCDRDSFDFRQSVITNVSALFDASHQACGSSSAFEEKDSNQHKNMENPSLSVIFSISDDSESSLPNDITSAEQLQRFDEITCDSDRIDTREPVVSTESTVLSAKNQEKVFSSSSEVLSFGQQEIVEHPNTIVTLHDSDKTKSGLPNELPSAEQVSRSDKIASDSDLMDICEPGISNVSTVLSAETQENAISSSFEVLGSGQQDIVEYPNTDVTFRVSDNTEFGLPNDLPSAEQVSPSDEIVSDSDLMDICEPGVTNAPTLFLANHQYVDVSSSDALDADQRESTNPSDVGSENNLMDIRDPVASNASPPLSADHQHLPATLATNTDETIISDDNSISDNGSSSDDLVNVTLYRNGNARLSSVPSVFPFDVVNHRLVPAAITSHNPLPYELVPIIPYDPLANLNLNNMTSETVPCCNTPMISFCINCGKPIGKVSCSGFCSLLPVRWCACPANKCPKCDPMRLPYIYPLFCRIRPYEFRDDPDDESGNCAVVQSTSVSECEFDSFSLPVHPFCLVPVYVNTAIINIETHLIESHVVLSDSGTNAMRISAISCSVYYKSTTTTIEYTDNQFKQSDLHNFSLLKNTVLPDPTTPSIKIQCSFFCSVKSRSLFVSTDRFLANRFATKF